MPISFRATNSLFELVLTCISTTIRLISCHAPCRGVSSRARPWVHLRSALPWVPDCGSQRWLWPVSRAHPCQYPEVRLAWVACSIHSGRGSALVTPLTPNLQLSPTSTDSTGLASLAG